MAAGADELAAALAAMVRHRLPGSLGIQALTRLSGGASQQTWAFDITQAGATLPAILRRQPPEAARSASGIGVELEAELIRRAGAAGVPAPQVLAVADASDGIGSGFLMGRVEGETLGKRILRDPTLAAIRPQLPAQAGRILAALHRVPVDGLALPQRTPAQDLTQLRERYRLTGAALPVFELAFSWLNAHCPPPGRIALVHGDFRHGNLMIGPDGIRAVLDWELAHIGDPMEDLGWLCVAAWRFGEIDKPVGGWGSREALFEAYAQASGHPVDPLHAQFWEVIGTLRWGVICLDLARSYPLFVDSDPGRAVERAQIGRRVSETDIDLLRLLAPRARAAGATVGAVASGSRTMAS